MSATIAAPRDRVWRALADPAERTAWDDRVLGEVTLSSEAARRGSRHRRSERTRGERLQWRYRMGNVPLVMHDERTHVEPEERIESRISIGSMHFDQTLTFAREQDPDAQRTRLGMKLIAHNSIAVIGEVVPRLDVQKLVMEYVDTTLRQVQKHCEGGD
jgi:uncharacterized protein YndB with AHSA1/START domain